MTDISPLASPFPALPEIGGVTRRVARAGYKNWGRCDLTFVELAEGTAVAGVTTQECVLLDRSRDLPRRHHRGQARALVVNAGNSNAFTGYRGPRGGRADHARRRQRISAARPSDVFVASTGVIGVPLPIDKAEAGLAAAFSGPSPAAGRPPPRRS
jgi:glutamate N-acetyltransferase/amino-acid N-acetyltransferase